MAQQDRLNNLVKTWEFWARIRSSPWWWCI